jgi:hypothetical protein
MNAAFVDGHVEMFTSEELIPMDVSDVPDGSHPFPEQIGMGKTYIPGHFE